LLEIEKRFLIKELPDLPKKEKGILFRMGYLTSDKEGAEIRIRQAGKSYYMTVITPDAKKKGELEIRISQEQFENLWKGTKGRRVRKRRLEYREKGNRFYIDIFQGKLKGLMIAEVYFRREEDAINFKNPKWLGDDVTENKKYKPKNLALSKD
jgi:CYTH domain-containing protein